MTGLEPAAVLLDMDGTLVESHPAVERAWRTWAAEYGVDPEAVLAVAHGSPSLPTARRFLPSATDAEVAAAAARQLDLQYDDLSDVTAIPGAHELLAVLESRGIPWAVVTSADVRLAKARLGAAGITPPLTVTIEDISEGKPSPEGYLLAASKLGVDPARCLVVEDAEVGVQAGRAAGAQTVGVRGVAADLTVTGLDDLARRLQ
ncbi:HAD-IA family hydrolase [Actinoplanes sp. NBRC 101535]|uniref:HAD-IA family hydrolase n=1 Tax=Actinoplanes sp. NBRC 101535 TaxID=3032196 RepID=UPI0024A39CDF|nr:HAD-IA family hydrolase [Actinoplanes sp. NBRC 101535]GLY02643.1 sugar phosphatase [Actinoplanes sp. NBRC 101535]